MLISGWGRGPYCTPVGTNPTGGCDILLEGSRNQPPGEGEAGLGRGGLSPDLKSAEDKVLPGVVGWRAGWHQVGGDPWCLTSALRSHREAAEGTRAIKEAVCIRGCPAKHPHTKVQACTHQRVPTCKPRTCPDFSILTRQMVAVSAAAPLGSWKRKGWPSF